MKPKGEIYSARSRKKRGEVVLSLPRLTRLFYFFLRGVGSGLVALAILGFFLTFGPIIREEVRFRFFPGKSQQTSGFGQVLEQIRAEEERKEFVLAKASELEAPDTYFSIVIPRISARAKVLPNVDAGDPNSYLPALKKGVAHAAGSVFPGILGATYLFAHSTDAPINIARYNAVFYLLREVEEGDEVFVFFLDEFYPYRVEEKLIVEPEDVSWLALAQEGEERLILQTCWPPGTTLKRLLLIAKPAAS